MAESDFAPEEDESRRRKPPPPVRRRYEDEDPFDDEEVRRRIRRDDDDNPVSILIPYKNTLALLAYYLGVFSLVPIFGLILGPAALVLGIAGVQYVKKHPTAHGTGHAIAGIVLGVLTSLGNWSIAIILLIAALESHK